jgi:hypothetical protein
MRPIKMREMRGIENAILKLAGAGIMFISYFSTPYPIINRLSL